MDDLTFVRRVRRAIHRRPELQHDERRTANLVERILVRLGLEPFRPASTSVATVVGAYDKQSAIGFRADLDALQITEVTGAEYASRNPGLMHACGHDGHAAGLLALARRLVAGPALSEPTLLVFQQAEEGHPSGAPQVLQGLRGHLLPREFIGFHLWPELPAGVIGIRPGALLASVAGVTIDVSGSVGRVHGTTFGQDAVDALATGHEMYTALSSMWPDRQPTDQQPVSLNIGRFEAGHEPNRVPTRCLMTGTLRALSWTEQDQAFEAIRETAARIEASRGARVQANFEPGIRPPVRNAPASVSRVRALCGNLGIDCRTYPEHPVGVSDDFGWYLNDSQGAMFFLGCAGTGGSADLHSPTFDFDESVLLNYVDVAAELARNPT